MGGSDLQCPNGFNFGGPHPTPATDVLPVPEAALPRMISEAGFILDELKAGEVYALTENIYVNMFAVTDEGVVLFDSPASLAVRLNP